MDILRDAWIPTDSGIVSPLEALRTAKHIQWSRGDWNAATLLLLHAIVQTGVVMHDKCPDRAAWVDLLERPPVDLESWVDGLDCGASPWQCLTVKKETSVSALFPESPGANTIKKAADITTWQESAVCELSQNEALIAVISSQFWGLASGAGHRSGCRGQNPLTIMVEPDEFGASLWKRVLINVLPKDEWFVATKSSSSEPLFEFPWKKTKTSAHTTPKHSNSLEMLWQMPRRWRIVTDGDGVVRRMLLEGGGINYEGWNHHPLTAYRESKKDGVTLISTFKTNTTVGFQDWAALVIGVNKLIRIPAVVNAYLEDEENVFNGTPLRLRCFGWASGDFGPAAWTESVVPFYVKADSQKIEKSIDEAKKSQDLLRECLTTIKPSLARDANQLFSRIEVSFYESVASGCWDTWKSVLRKQVREIFWQVMKSNSFAYDKILLKVNEKNKSKFRKVM